MVFVGGTLIGFHTLQAAGDCGEWAGKRGNDRGERQSGPRVSIPATWSGPQRAAARHPPTRWGGLIIKGNPRPDITW